MAATFEIFDTLPSTQSLCLERLKEGREGPTWLLAREQTKGVGRHGKAWIGPRGNFMASRYEVMALDVRSAPQLAFVAAVAVYEMLRPLVSDTDENLRIKWPNDILHRGRKLCGILVQTEQAFVPDHLGVIIGLGMNLTRAPEIPEYRTVALRDISEEAASFDAVHLLHKISGHLDGVLELWREKGFDDIAKAWFKRAYGRGMLLRLTPNAEKGEGVPVSGELVGLDPFGALQVLAHDGQVYTVTGGDIHYGDLHAAGY